MKYYVRGGPYSFYLLIIVVHNYPIKGEEAITTINVLVQKNQLSPTESAVVQIIMRQYQNYGQVRNDGYKITPVVVCMFSTHTSICGYHPSIEVD